MLNYKYTDFEMPTVTAATYGYFSSNVTLYLFTNAVYLVAFRVKFCEIN